MCACILALMYVYALTQVYLHNVCMVHTHLCSSAHLCHQQLCSTCWGHCHSPLHSSSHSIKVTSLCSPKGARHPRNRTDNMAAEHIQAASFSLIYRYKRYQTQYVITESHSFQNQRGEATKEGICLCSVQSGPLVKAMTAKWKNPTGTQAVRSSMLGWPA